MWGVPSGARAIEEYVPVLSPPSTVVALQPEPTRGLNVGRVAEIPLTLVQAVEPVVS